MQGGKERDTRGAVSTNVVLQLSDKLLDEGRTIVTENYHSSIELANKLLDRETHLLGTLRSNRKGNPKTKDKCDVLMISTTHSAEMVETEWKSGQKVKKPKMIRDYNHDKTPIDTSDQMSSY
ncbi:hypothetical protein PR048_022311 [Dryococelus australis]|uniref:PiggyBac transposable element-derived protein domain-containing protein n=1 Tax=Dryococelus australis TaxID=614101 RepID=A0ABQ9H0S9_9NEOP|nr:hypothetical protein PR048_022311 [Dryococelus australis]